MSEVLTTNTSYKLKVFFEQTKFVEEKTHILKEIVFTLCLLYSIIEN